MERLEPTSFNVLNGAERLNGLNDLNVLRQLNGLNILNDYYRLSPRA